MSDEKESPLHVKGQELLKKIKELVHEGTIRKIVVSDDQDKKLLEIPLTLGVAGLVLVPVVALLGTVGALAMNYKLTVVRRDEAGDGNKPAS
jgi:hypothetical protein